MRLITIYTDGCAQYKTRLSKQEARSFHRPALQFPANIELRFSKVRSAKKKKDKSGRKVGKGGDVGEGLRKTSDLTLKDTSNFVLWELSVSWFLPSCHFVSNECTGRASSDGFKLCHGEYSCELLPQEG